MELKDRLKLLEAAQKDPKLQSELLALCASDHEDGGIKFWINTFVFTADPRAEIRDLPFNLYPFQGWFVDELLRGIREQDDIGIEKSRDMGASWLVCCVFTYCWLYRPGWSFHMGSRRETEVDNGTSNPESCLFGKIRYILEFLPTWMVPSHTYKKLVLENHDNGNIITGESANPSFGRSQRFRAILFDELAFWECAEAAYAACADTTNCRLALSTPFGEGNMYYKIMHNPNNELQVWPGTAQAYKDKDMIYTA